MDFNGNFQHNFTDSTFQNAQVTSLRRKSSMRGSIQGRTAWAPKPSQTSWNALKSIAMWRRQFQAASDVSHDGCGYLMIKMDVLWMLKSHDIDVSWYFYIFFMMDGVTLWHFGARSSSIFQLRGRHRRGSERMTSLSKNSVAKDRHQPRTLQLPVPGDLVDWWRLGVFEGIDSYPLVN